MQKFKPLINAFLWWERSATDGGGAHPLGAGGPAVRSRGRPGGGSLAQEPGCGDAPGTKRPNAEGIPDYDPAAFREALPSTPSSPL